MPTPKSVATFYRIILDAWDWLAINSYPSGIFTFYQLLFATFESITPHYTGTRCATDDLMFIILTLPTYGWPCRYEPNQPASAMSKASESEMCDLSSGFIFHCKHWSGETERGFSGSLWSSIPYANPALVCFPPWRPYIFMLSVFVFSVSLVFLANLKRKDTPTRTSSRIQVFPAALSMKEQANRRR